MDTVDITKRRIPPVCPDHFQLEKVLRLAGGVDFRTERVELYQDQVSVRYSLVGKCLNFSTKSIF